MKTVKKSPAKKESEEPAILSLAPFTPSAKVFFEDVKVGTEAIRQLVIKNPTNRDVEVSREKKFRKVMMNVFYVNKMKICTIIVSVCYRNKLLLKLSSFK